jgi:DNA-binding PadR family transcriptional regulator
MIRNLFLGFIRLHILYHASQEEIYGVEMIKELGRHGYQLSPGTLYPILHNLEKVGYLDLEKRVVEGKVRKFYRATNLGKKALKQATVKVIELMNEIGINNSK